MFRIMRRILTAVVPLLLLLVLVIPVILSAPTRTPSEPRNLLAVPRDGSAILTWDEPDIGSVTVTNYHIYRAAQGIDPWMVTLDADTLSYTDRGLENGLEYNYYVTAENSIGESGASNFATVTPDGDAPEVEITSPSEGSVYPSGDILVSWIGSDLTTEIEKYEIRIDSDLWISTGLYREYQISDLERGNHLILVRAIDAALNMGYDQVNISIDDRAPIVIIRSPENHEFIKEKNVTIKWDAFEGESMIAGYEVLLDGKFTGYRGEGENYTIRNLKDGSYRIEVLGYDVVGNVGRDSVNVTVDTHGPTIYIFEPDMDLVTNESMVRFLWIGEDDIGVVGYSIYHIDIGWIDVGLDTEAFVGPLPEGINRLKLKAEDGVGWETVIERIVLVDLTPPEIYINYPVEGNVYSTENITIQWNGSDELSGLDDIWVRVDEGKWLKDSDWKHEIKSLRNKRYVFSVKGIDNAGNEIVSTVIFSVDNESPTALEYGPIGSDILLPQNIWVKFNEEMGPVQFNVTDLTGVMEINGDRYIWIPDDRFEFGKSYLVKIIGEDLSGNPLEYFAWTFTLTDQVMITGAVYDSDGDPIKEARIILDSGKTTLTGADGRFNFTVAMGNRTILIKKDGYDSKEIVLDLRPDRSGYVGNVYLDDRAEPIGSKVSSFLLDLWTYIVLGLVAVVIGLVIFLFKDRFMNLRNWIKNRNEIEVKIEVK